MSDPLVSVVIPFYSGISWLEDALKSVMNQRYNNLEILVINDGSKEDMSSLINKYSEEVKFINKENGGPASARNKGIVLATGKYIAFLDSDDVWLPGKLQKQISYMESNNCMWSQHSYEMFWEESDKTKTIYTDKLKGEILKDTYISFKVQTSCVIVRKDILDKNSIVFPENMRYGQDMVFFREIAKLYSLGYVDGILSKFRIRGSNAGFRAKVQLADKAVTWNYIKTDRDILNMLPINAIMAYKIASKFNPIIRSIDSKHNNNSNDGVVEFIAKALYLLPYLLLKLNKRKIG